MATYHPLTSTVQNSGLPLVVDLDGTLTPTDTLVESVLALIRHRPAMLPVIFLWLLSGRAGFKARIANRVRLDVALLPWRTVFVDWLREQHASGRKLVLATAAHEKIAHDVAKELPFFDQILASGKGINLKGAAKLAAIRSQLGSRFTYAGDSRADLCVWAGAETAVLVGAPASVAASVRGTVPIEREFASERRDFRMWMRAARAHQWLKNVLLFVPLFVSFGFSDLHKLGTVAAAFVAFSLAASATYLLNDLWDLDSDRQHPRKRHRPLASGALPLLWGIGAAGGLMALALGVGVLTSLTFAAMLVGYIALTTSYSWILKRYVLMDVLMLALLYTYRVLVGAVIIDLHITPWLLAFSVFTFLSLALVKRCAELVALSEAGKIETPGRDYRTSDLAVLWPLGVGSSLCSVVVFGLYIGTPEARAVYGETPLMWLVGVGLMYWTSRMWIKTSRGEMHDDPIVFALRDQGSRIAVLAMAVVPVVAHFAR